MVAKLVRPEVARDVARLPRAQQEAISHALTAVAGALVSSSPEGIAQFERRLRESDPVAGEPEEADDELLRRLEMRNALRRFAAWREIEARSISGPELVARLGVSRQRLGQLRDGGRLLALRIPLRRELLYPAWQFTPDGSLHPVLPQLLEAARETGLSPLDLDALLTNPAAADGQAPAALLHTGATDRVLEIIRAALSQGS